MATADILIATDDSVNSDALFEIVNGERVELLPMGMRENHLANVLSRRIWTGLGDEPPGEPFVEGLFRMKTDNSLSRRPDVAFVPYERWPDRIVPETEAWDVVPSLAVEIISKSNTVNEVQQKIHEYFERGVSAVWVVFPKQREIYVYENPKKIQVLDEKDTLVGGEVLPGFELPLASLFAHVK